MLVVTGNGTLDWVYHLNIDHVLQLNDFATTYNLCVQKKIDTLVKVLSNINYIVNYANDHIETAYRVHALKKEATNTSSLSSIPESAITSKTSASTTVQVGNHTPAVSKEKRFAVGGGQCHVREFRNSNFHGIVESCTKITKGD